MRSRQRSRWRSAMAGGSAALVAVGLAVAVVAQPSAAAPPDPAGTAGPPAAGARMIPPPARAAKPAPSRERAASDARDIVRRHGRAVRAAEGEEYRVRSVLIDPDGGRHVRFDRTHRGLPVLGGDYVVHANPDGSFRDTSVAQHEAIAVGTRATLGAKAATAVAVREFRGGYDRTTARLVIDAAYGPPVLAWEIVVMAAGPRRLHVVVDAGTGAVRRSFDGVQAAEPGTGHSLHGGEVPLSTTLGDDGAFTLTDPDRGGARTLDGLDSQYPIPETSVPFADADNVWGNGARDDRATVAADVHYGVAVAFDYFKREYGRNGVRDDGTAPVAIVHENAANAAFFTDCYCMSFGDGDATVGPFVSLDIVGHEWAHGVSFATAGLIYDGESGALNEATSDIFGTLVEFAAGNPADPPDYLVGEQMDNGGEGGPLRYMDDPVRNGSADSCWSPEVAEHDVHDSSGVANKFFYMLAVGSGGSAWGDSPTCADAPAVAGIGNDKAGRIWYRALTAYMLSNTNFSAAREATLTAASDLYGADGTEYAAVDAAWKAVNVDGIEPVPQEPALWRPDNQESGVGEVVRLQIRAEDPQRDEITFTAADLPAGLSISDRGLITGSLTTAGWEYVTVSATDSAGHVGTTSFFWDVFGPPTVRNPGDRSNAVGELVVLGMTATDDDSDWELTYRYAGLPDGLEGYGNYIFGEPERPGTWNASVTVTDSEHWSTTVSFVWTITARDRATGAAVPAAARPAPARREPRTTGSAP